MKYFLAIGFLVVLISGCTAAHPIEKVSPDVENIIDSESDRLRADLDKHLINQDKSTSDAIYRKALEHEAIK